MIRVRNFLPRLARLFIGGILTSATASQAATSADDIWQATNRYMSEYQHRLQTEYSAGQPEVGIEYTISALDNRLALADCDQPLTIEDKGQRNGQRINLRVSCQGANPWSIYVPVTLQIMRPVIVANRPIGRGERISAADLSTRRMDTGALAGAYFSNVNELVGQQARRVIAADDIVYDHSIEPPVVIKKGESVMVTAQTGSLSVKISGIAMTDGRKGEQITVKNRQSQRVLEAIVSGPGQVEVAM